MDEVIRPRGRTLKRSSYLVACSAFFALPQKRCGRSSRWPIPNQVVLSKGRAFSTPGLFKKLRIGFGRRWGLVNSPNGLFHTRPFMSFRFPCSRRC